MIKNRKRALLCFFICFSTADPNHQCIESQIFPSNPSGPLALNYRSPSTLVFHMVFHHRRVSKSSEIMEFPMEFPRFPTAEWQPLPSWGSNSKDLTTKSTKCRDSPVDSVNAAVVPNVLQGPLETGDCRNRRIMEKAWRAQVSALASPALWKQEQPRCP